LWAVVVIILSAVDTADMNKPAFLNIPDIDKVIHFVLYFIFTFMLIIDLLNSGITGCPVKMDYFFAGAAATIFGGAMELMQIIPQLQRNASIYDFYANMAGAVAAVFLFSPVNRIISIFVKADE